MNIKRESLFGDILILASFGILSLLTSFILILYYFNVIADLGRLLFPSMILMPVSLLSFIIYYIDIKQKIFTYRIKKGEA